MEEQPLKIQLMHTLHRFKRINLSTVWGGLTKGEFFLLGTLREDQWRHPEAEGMYAGTLAEALAMSAPGVSRILRGLEAKGMIARSASPDDRRNTLIRATEKGKRACTCAQKSVQNLMDRVFQVMGEENMRTLLVLFTQVIDTMEQEIGNKENEKPNNQDEGETECSKF